MKTLFVSKGLTGLVVICCLFTFSRAHGQGNIPKDCPGEKHGQNPLKGEVFLTSISTQSYLEYDSGSGTYVLIPNSTMAVHKNFDKICFKSKRLGKIAYNENGDPKIDEVPVFVGEGEYRRYMRKLYQQGILLR